MAEVIVHFARLNGWHALTLTVKNRGQKWPVRNRELLFLVAAVELGVAWMILKEPESLFSLSLVAWVSTAFLAYRAGLWSIGYQGQCRCLGNLADTLGTSPATIDWIAKIILAFLFVGSCFFIGKLLLWQRFYHGALT